MRLSRTDKSTLAVWWYSVDWLLLTAITGLAIAGMIVSMAASPAVAMRRGMAPFALAERHIIFSLIALAVMVCVSALGHAQIRRVALLLLNEQIERDPIVAVAAGSRICPCLLA